MAIRTVSATAVSAWRCCPKYYEYRFVDSIVPLNPDKDRTQLGRRLHYYLELHGKGLLPKSFIPPEAPLKEPWAAYQSYMQPFAACQQESEWTFNVPIVLDKGKVILTGRIDRLIWTEERLLVLDWKSGPFTSNHSQEQYWQMAFYAWSLSQMHPLFPSPVTVIETRLISLQSPLQEQVVTFDSNQLQQSGEELRSVLMLMDAEKYNFLPNPIKDKQGNPFCQSCYFQRICPEVQTII